MKNSFLKRILNFFLRPFRKQKTISTYTNNSTVSITYISDATLSNEQEMLLAVIQVLATNTGKSIDQIATEIKAKMEQLPKSENLRFSLNDAGTDVEVICF